MCGFLGVIQNRPVLDLDLARGALDSLAHRGPDAAGDWSEESVFLGHRRLSIIDLETGDQPMVSNDGRYVVVFNGEIYNFPVLRRELEGEGARFTTHSDTEVLLEGYRRWGVNVVERLNGMFAFIIWDRHEKQVFGARDRLGIKPFCWTMHDGALIVSSTLEPLALFSEFRRIDPVAVRDLMTFDYVPAPRTMLHDVFKLEPGSRFLWSFGQEFSPDRYWSPPLADRAASIPDEEEMEALLDSAVERQMISDVPIGVFLSGGIDSSLLVALMSRHSAKPVRTFSVSFAGRSYDESGIAAIVAEQFGTEHTVIEAEETQADDLLNLLGRLDEPFCDPAFVPTFALSAATRRSVKVALSGDGADELLGGYEKYFMGLNTGGPGRLFPLIDGVLRTTSWRPRGVGRVFERFLGLDDRIRYSWVRYGDFPVFRKDLRQLLAKEFQAGALVEDYFGPFESKSRRFGSRFDMDSLMRADLETYLSENCLVKTDRASMLASLEVRVPFLDEAVLDRILPLPAEARIAEGRLKALIQPLVRRLLPREVWDRPKHGFNVPLGAQLAGPWAPAVEEAFEWGEANLKVFDYSYLRRLGRINHSTRNVGSEIWNPFVFTTWAMARSITL